MSSRRPTPITRGPLYRACCGTVYGPAGTYYPRAVYYPRAAYYGYGYVGYGYGRRCCW